METAREGLIEIQVLEIINENNLKANWLLKEVLSYPSAFKNIPEQRQLRALEAALFMIGYEVPDKSEK